MRPGQTGGQGDGLLKVDARAVAVVRAQFQSAPQQMGFGGIAPAENAVDDGHAAGGLAIADKSGSIEIVESRVAGLIFLERGQELHSFLVSSQTVITNGEQKGDLLFELGRERDGPFEAGGGFGKAARFVIGETQIQQEGGVVRALAKSAVVFGDCLVVAARACQRGAQIRTSLHGIGLGGEVFAIRADRGIQIACLVQRNGMLEKRVGTGSGLLPAKSGGQEAEDEAEWGGLAFGTAPARNPGSPRAGCWDSELV